MVPARPMRLHVAKRSLPEGFQLKKLNTRCIKEKGWSVAGAARLRGDKSLLFPPVEGLAYVPVVDELWLRRCPLVRCQAMAPLTELRAILRKPNARMFQEADQIQAHEKVGGTATGPFPKP